MYLLWYLHKLLQHFSKILIFICFVCVRVRVWLNLFKSVCMRLWCALYFCRHIFSLFKTVKQLFITNFICDHREYGALGMRSRMWFLGYTHTHIINICANTPTYLSMRVCCIKLARHGKRIASKHIIYQIYVHKNQIYMFRDREESCIVDTRTHARLPYSPPQSTNVW